ncbi:hypothetical protein TNCV_2849231 [Trichonephila clavipes]|nr:hypothetical protein TNCV_2849231 [Trichonephila clavipes]
MPIRQQRQERLPRKCWTSSSFAKVTVDGVVCGNTRHLPLTRSSFDRAIGIAYRVNRYFRISAPVIPSSPWRPDVSEKGGGLLRNCSFPITCNKNADGMFELAGGDAISSKTSVVHPVARVNTSYKAAAESESRLSGGKTASWKHKSIAIRSRMWIIRVRSSPGYRGFSP